VQLELSEGYAAYHFSLVRGETPDEDTTQAPEAQPPQSQVDLGTIEGRVVERRPDGSLVGLPGATVGLRKVGGPAELTA